MLLIFQKGQNDYGQNYSKAKTEKYKDRNMELGIIKNTHSGVKRSRKYFSVIHFSVMAFLKVSDIGQHCSQRG
jgi:hypothetical protein